MHVYKDYFQHHMLQCFLPLISICTAVIPVGVPDTHVLGKLSGISAKVVLPAAIDESLKYLILNPYYSEIYSF